MAVVVGHGVVPIKPDFGADFHRNIQREGAKATDGLTKQFGGAFKNIAKLAGGIFIGAQVIGQLKSAFTEAAEAQKVGRLTEQVIKTTGGAAKITAKQVGDLSAAISNKTAIDDEAIQSGANLLLCLEESAEALTRDRGWVTHDQLAIGDEILAYDPETDTSRWEPIIDFYRYEVDTELIHWKSKQIDVKTTPHHRWWTIGQHDQARFTPQFQTTEQISGKQIRVKIGGGLPGGFADEPTIPDDIVELLGWVVTEGWFLRWKDQSRGRKPRPCAKCDRPARNLAGTARCDECARKPIQNGRTSPPPKMTEATSKVAGVGFGQSQTANPKHVARIRELVDRLVRRGHTISETQAISEWRGRESVMSNWMFAGDLGREVRRLLPDKKLTPALISSLTSDQAEMLLDVLIAGDGHTDVNGSSQYIQKDPGQLAMVAMLCSMLGIRTTVLGRGDSILLCSTNTLKGSSVHAERVQYSGVVWCPQIRTQIFMARNRGRTFWTGNTFTKVRNEAGKGNAVFDRTVAVANDMSVALGQDMKSSSLQLGKALNDPIKGVTALSRAGVSFTQQQKDQIKAMQESGDLLGAQKLILAEVETQFGGAAAAVATPVERLKVVWGNLLEDLGTRAMPIVEKVATWLGDMLPKALDIAGAAFGRVAEFLAPAVDVLKEFFYTLISGFTEDEGTPVEMFALRVRDAFFGLIDVGKRIVPVIIDIVKNFTFIGLVVTHFEGIKTAIGVVADALKKLGEAAAPALRWVVDFVKANPKPVFAAFGAVIAAVLVPAAIAWATSMASAAIATVVATAPVILIGAAIALLAGGIVYAYQHFEVFRNVVDTVADVLVAGLGIAVRFIVDLWNNYLLPGGKAVASFFVDTLWPAVQTAWDFISKAVVAAWQNVLLPIFNFISAVIRNVVIPAFNFIKAVVVDFVFPLVMAIIRDAWGVIQPIFGFIAQHVFGVVVPAFRAISDAVSAMWGFVQPVLQTVITFIQDKLGPVWEGMRAMAAVAFQALPGLIGAALRLVGGIVAGFLDGVGSIADALKLGDIGKVLHNGANSARGWGQAGPAGPAVRDQGAGQQLRNSGGPIYGPNVDRDIVPAMLTPGEFVMRRSAVEKYGPGFMAKVNAGRYRKGGLIPDIDIAGLADGVVDKVRAVGTAALDRVWPRMDVPNNFTGLGPGGANYLRDAVIQLIRGKEQAMGSQSGGGFSRSGGGGPAGQYTAGMQRARADILNLFGPMAVGGYANRNIAGTGQKSMHALHRAWDFMTGQNVPRGNAVSRHLIANASSYGLKGLIWNAQKNFGSGWQPYGHPGGGRSATLQHLDHVHAEFFSKGGKVPYGRYDQGGFLPTGLSIAENRTGAPERVGGGAGIAIGEVHNHGLEDVAAFWQMAEFHAMKGSFG